MIKIFNAIDKNYGSNGDIVLSPLKAVVHKEDNGLFYLELETDLSYADYIVANNIVVADTPQGEQAFRFGNEIQKTKFKIYAKAYHVFYDAVNYVIRDSYVVDKNCNDALDHLNMATDTPSPFTTLSNIANINSYRCVRKSLYEAINVVLERWGGHLVRDNWTIKILDEIGQDNGIEIRYKKNLKEIQATENWNEVTTKLLPVGKEGLLLDELYVYSDIQYDIPYTRVQEFNQTEIVQDDYLDDEGNPNVEAYQEALVENLREQAQAYVEEHSIPKVNYVLKANLEKVTDVGDTIKVIDERLGIDLITHILSYDYDCILNKYKELEFGNFQPKLSGLVNKISQQTANQINENNAVLKVELGTKLQEAQDKIWNALGSSYVIYEGDKILIVDSLPKESARNVIMINNGGIAFGQNGINGNFSSAWTIDNVLNMEQINVINLTADLIRGGTLKLGSNINQNGILEVYDEANTLIAILDKNGLKMYGQDGSYILMNNDVGFAGYDKDNNKIYWVDRDEFHQKKSVVEEEITLCNKMRFIPITIENDDFVNDGIALVSVMGGDE